jgi:hypothetical protein
MNHQILSIFGYANGGYVGPNGMPMMGGQPSPPPGVTPPGQQAPQPNVDVNAEVSQFEQQHPQQVEQIKQVMLQALQSGQLTVQELNTIVQLAMAAASNPNMYPAIRKYAINNGVATEQDLPQQYNRGLIFAILLAAKAVQGGDSKPPEAVPSMATGGPVPSNKQDGATIIQAHEGEYVIPKHVVRAKGTEFFDNMVSKYDPANVGK